MVDAAAAPSGVHILIISGGTGGHIFPALAVAEELRSRQTGKEARFQIEFVGTQRPLEARLIPAAGFPFRAVAAAGLKGIGGIKKLQNLMVLPRTALAVARILHDFRPKVVLGVGGYLAGPVMLEAALVGIPTVLIEPNAQPGVTNRLLAPVVSAAAVGFAETAPVYGRHAHLTGIPVRREFFTVPPPTSGQFTLLVLGGSQGSRAINQAVVGALPRLIESSDSMRIIHQTGEHDYNDVLNSYRECRLLSEVHPFIDDMPGALARADLVISRAGALTVSELGAAGRPAVFIPFPGAGQHQLDNARAMEKAGAARVIPQSELTPMRLAEKVRQLMAAPAALAAMGEKARGLARPDAAAAIANLVENLAER